MIVFKIRPCKLGLFLALWKAREYCFKSYVRGLIKSDIFAWSCRFKKNWLFLWKCRPWLWPRGHPWGGDGADKNFRPIPTIRPNMNENYQRVFKIGGLINFNAKTLTLCDGKTNKRTNKRAYVWTNERKDERKSEKYISAHTSYGPHGPWATMLTWANCCKLIRSFTHHSLSACQVFEISCLQV